MTVEEARSWTPAWPKLLPIFFCLFCHGRGHPTSYCPLNPVRHG